MATWDSASLLAQLNRVCKRPASDEITDAEKYLLLTLGQMEVVEEIASRYPYALYNAAGPQALSTSDSKVFTFGNDSNGHAQAPFGHVGIYPSLGSYPDSPWILGGQYLDEGTQIRIPNDQQYAGTLYWQGIPTPADISASTQPSLRPAPARRLIVLKAAIAFAREGGLRPEIEASALAEWNEAFPRAMMNFRTRFRKGGAIGTWTAVSKLTGEGTLSGEGGGILL